MIKFFQNIVGLLQVAREQAEKAPATTGSLAGPIVVDTAAGSSHGDSGKITTATVSSSASSSSISSSVLPTLKLSPQVAPSSICGSAQTADPSIVSSNLAHHGGLVDGAAVPHSSDTCLVNEGLSGACSASVAVKL